MSRLTRTLPAKPAECFRSRDPLAAAHSCSTVITTVFSQAASVRCLTLSDLALPLRAVVVRPQDSRNEPSGVLASSQDVFSRIAATESARQHGIATLAFLLRISLIVKTTMNSTAHGILIANCSPQSLRNQ